MGRHIVFLLATIFVLVAAFVFVERSFSPTFKQCVATQEANESGNSPKENQSVFGATVDSYVRCTGDFVNDSGSAITAIATVIIAAFTFTLWIATKTQSELSREAFIADKRAFVFAGGIAPFYEPDVATGHFNWRIGVTWKNSGDTPTRNLRLYVDGFLSNVPISPTFDFSQASAAVPPGPGMLGPKMDGVAGQAPHMPGRGLTPQDVLDMQTGSKFFYVWGWARYWDVLPNTPEHLTRFCWQITAAGNPFTFNPIVDPNSVRFFNIYQPRGNCADDECKLQGLG